MVDHHALTADAVDIGFAVPGPQERLPILRCWGPPQAGANTSIAAAGRPGHISVREPLSEDIEAHGPEAIELCSSLRERSLNCRRECALISCWPRFATSVDAAC